MSRKRKSLDLSDRCRFCLTLDDACMSQLFVDSIRPEIDDLQKCTDAEITEKPNFPKSICFKCLYKLEMWRDFKSEFLKTNKKIQSHLNIFHEPIVKTNQVHSEVTEESPLSPDNDKKRMRLDSGEALPTVAPVPTSPLNKSIQSDSKMSTEETNKLSPTNKSQISDESVSNSRKLTRSKKVEREASTKRWEERKSALLAATGAVPSESESETGGDLSPVQKARAKTNQQLEQELEKQRKLQKALKNLQTDLTEKYKVNSEGLVETQERKTRSRRSNNEEQQASEAVKVSPAKIPKINLPKTSTANELPAEKVTDAIDQSNDSINPPNDPVNNSIDPVNDSVNPDNDPIDPVDDSIDPVDDSIDPVDDSIDPVDDSIDPVNVSIDPIDPVSINEDKESTPSPVSSRSRSARIKSKELTVRKDLMDKSKEVKPNVDEEKSKDMEINDDLDNEIDVEQVENEEPEVTLPQKGRTDFKPQVVTSEVSIGNATYVVTLTLDMPDASGSKSGDISLKTNGINVDSGSKDGKQIDITNKLQKVKSGADKGSPVKENCDKPDTDAQTCLKIEVEGMEVEALQRVQLELAKFVNEDVIDILLDTSSKKKQKPQPKKFKDSYETLDRQLKGIIEKVLTSHYSSDKVLAVIKDQNSHSNLSPEFVQAAETSPIFQPKVVVVRINLGDMCKTYNINNIHVLEEIKRKKGLVGPLSRTLGKRRPKMPKKFEDFSLDFNEALKPAAKKVDVSLASITLNVMDDEVMIDAPADETEKELAKNEVPASKAAPAKSESEKLDQKKTAKATPPESPKAKTIQPPIALQKTPPKSSVEKKIVIVPNAQSAKPTNKVTTITKISGGATLTNSKSKNTPTTTITSVSKQVPTPGSPPKQNQNQRHICGICSKELPSKEAAEAHVKNHSEKLREATLEKSKQAAAIGKELSKNASAISSGSSSSSSSSSSIPTPPPSSQPASKPKPKLMRCKRCQAIVEARHVKTHVCNSVKYNCTMCECSFGAEHLLVAHLETHSHAKKKPAPKSKSPKKSSADDNRSVVVLHSDSEAKDEDEVVVEENEQSNAGYSCFVCDKMFVEESEMKDHLQEHCEEGNEDISDKIFQCAFCGDKFQTEESLETHVGNHLQEDEEEKIHKLISEAKRDKPKKNLHKCDRCSLTFSSSLQLAMHVSEHEDDAMDGESDHHVCTVCDEIFDTADELADHAYVHDGNTNVCILCERPFDSIRELQEHVSTHL